MEHLIYLHKVIIDRHVLTDILLLFSRIFFCSFSMFFSCSSSLFPCSLMIFLSLMFGLFSLFLCVSTGDYWFVVTMRFTYISIIYSCFKFIVVQIQTYPESSTFLILLQTHFMVWCYIIHLYLYPFSVYRCYIWFYIFYLLTFMPAYISGWFTVFLLYIYNYQWLFSSYHFLKFLVIRFSFLLKKKKHFLIRPV